MANDLNRCEFIGRLGDDPETRFASNGNAITNIRIAVSQKWRDKQSGDIKERTEWVRISMFGKLAEIAGEYLRKGKQIFVAGELRTRKWQTQDGQDRYTTEIVANEMQMLGGGGQDGQQRPQGQQQKPSDRHGNQRADQQQPPADYDDDIPF